MTATGKLRRYGHYMRGITSSAARSKIRHRYRSFLMSNDGWVAGEPFPAMNRKRRELLHNAIFAVEDEMESRAGGQPDHPTVVELRAVRNRVMDDLGWND